MNQKSIIAILGVVVVILIGTTVYFATIVVEQTKPAPAPAVQQPVQSAQGILYTNTKYGFSLNLPNNWSGYKVEESKSFTPGYFYVAFKVPGVGKKVADVDVFTVVVAEVGAYESYAKTCITEPDPGCPDSTRVLAKTQKYVFEFSHSQGAPGEIPAGKDLNFEQVKKGFNLVN